MTLGITTTGFPPLKQGIRLGYADIVLDSSYVAGGWSISASDLDLDFIFHLIPPASASGYNFAVDRTSDTAVKLMALKGGSLAALMEVPGTWAVDGDGAETNGGGIAGGSVTLTEATNAFAVVSDAGVLQLLDDSGTAAEYTSNYQLFPDTEAINDYAAFGAAVPFCEAAFDGGGTAGVYTGDSCLWEYADGATAGIIDSWATLTLVAGGASDRTDSTAGDGLRPFQQAGALSFIPPSDWVSGALAASGAGSQTAYWIRSRVTAANIGTIPILTKEHQIVTPNAGALSCPFTGTITKIRLDDGAQTLHTDADVKFILMNFTTGAHSGELTFAQDIRSDILTLTNALAVTAGDSLGVLVTVEDGTNEVINGIIELSGAVVAEAAASEAQLNGVSIRCFYFGG